MQVGSVRCLAELSRDAVEFDLPSPQTALSQRNHDGTNVRTAACVFGLNGF